MKGVVENQKPQSSDTELVSNMATHTEETISSAVVLACLLMAVFAIVLAAPLLFLLTHIG
jgi:hypothetical protein